MSISNIKDLRRDLLFIVLMLGSPSWTSLELLSMKAPSPEGLPIGCAPFVRAVRFRVA
jgi:hypothetical protein